MPLRKIHQLADDLSVLFLLRFGERIKGAPAIAVIQSPILPLYNSLVEGREDEGVGMGVVGRCRRGQADRRGTAPAGSRGRA